MLEAACLGRTLSRAEYDAAEEPLRAALLEAQLALRQRRLPAVVLLAGVAKAGSGESVNLLNEWMDPRWIDTRAFGPPRQEARERPHFWRYATTLPAKGRLGLFDAAWYQPLLEGRAEGRLAPGAFEAGLEQITAFERTLTDDGWLVLKLWLHLGADQQRQRLEALEADPLTAWRVSPQDWHQHRRHAEWVAATEEMLLRTSRALAPWEVVEGSCPRWRAVAVGERVLAALRRHLAAHPEPAPAPATPARRSAEAAPARSARPLKAEKARKSDKAGRSDKAGKAPTTILDALRFPSEAMPKEAYAVALEQAQGRLHRLQRRAHTRGIATVVAFEGWDAAGKGGAIRRVTRALDARQYDVIPIAAPTEEERAHHYLWRFWRHVPSAGRFAIFDRTWYGRVLVERVEGFAAEEAWRRAYAEINQFERHLVSHGQVLVKIFLHISDAEQRSRFEERAATPHKQWKITEEDWRNRARRGDYALAIHDMVAHTSTAEAPWHLVPADDKRFARVRVLDLIADALEVRLGQHTEHERSED